MNGTNKKIKLECFSVILCTFAAMKAFGNFVRYNKELGINEYDITVYASFFADNIQLHLEYDDKGSWVYDGLSYDDFAVRWDKDPDSFCNALQKMIKDEELSKLQDEIEEKIGIRIDYFNFYPLCSFVDAIVMELYFVLLKPTIKYIITELKEAKEIVITNSDETKVTITNSQVMESVVNAIKAKADEGKHYETEKMVRIDEIANNVVMQSKFTFWVATFLREYFPNAKRRSNCCIVSEPEQRLILRLLTYFNLAPDNITLTTARFRQLVICYHNLKMDEGYSVLPVMGLVPVTFVKYEDWHRKSMDWTKTSLVLHPLQEGETVTIGKL